MRKDDNIFKGFTYSYPGNYDTLESIHTSFLQTDFINRDSALEGLIEISKIAISSEKHDSKYIKLTIELLYSISIGFYTYFSDVIYYEIGKRIIQKANENLNDSQISALSFYIRSLNPDVYDEGIIKILNSFLKIPENWINYLNAKCAYLNLLLTRKIVESKSKFLKEIDRVFSYRQYHNNKGQILIVECAPLILTGCKQFALPDKHDFWYKIIELSIYDLKKWGIKNNPDIIEYVREISPFTEISPDKWFTNKEIEYKFIKFHTFFYNNQLRKARRVLESLLVNDNLAESQKLRIDFHLSLITIFKSNTHHSHELQKVCENLIKNLFYIDKGSVNLRD